MKSLVLCPYLPFPPNHGGRIRSAMLCTALSSLGEVVLAAPLSEAHEDEARAIVAENGCRLAPLGAPSTTTSPLRKLGCWSRSRSEVLERRWTPVARARVAALLEREAFDVVALDSSFVIPLLPVPCAVPIVIQLHNLEFAVMRRSAGHAPSRVDAWLRGMEWRCIERAERRVLRNARLAVAVSEDDAELARAADPRTEPHLGAAPERRRRCPAHHVDRRRRCPRGGGRGVDRVVRERRRL